MNSLQNHNFTPADIRTTRLSVGLTQLELGWMVGITQTAVSNYELGIWKPLPHIFRAIKRALGIELPPAIQDRNGGYLIELTSGRFVTVDFEDFEQFKKNVWREDGRGYAKSTFRSEDGTPKTLYLHRLITNAPTGTDVHHLDENRLNNRRANLSVSQPDYHKAHHAKNRQRMKPGLAGNYKGVYLRKDNGKYMAKVAHLGNQGYLGQFETPEEAARAVDKRLKEIWGDDVWTNLG